MAAGRAPWEKERRCEGCIRVATVYSQFISWFLLICSGVVIALGVILFRSLGETLEEIDLRSPALATVIFGCCLCAFALVGIVANWFESLFFRFVYVIGSLFITVGVMAAGVALLTYTEYLKNVGANNLQVRLEEKILTYELALFQECCDPNNDAPEFCDENGNKFPCYADEELFNRFVGFIGERTCGILGEVSISGAPLVGEEPEACGDQDVRTFVEIISDFMKDNIRRLGLFNLGLAIAMLLLVIANCTLIWSGDVNKYDSEKKNKKEKDDGDDYSEADSDH